MHIVPVRLQRTEPSCFSPLNELFPRCDAGLIPLWGILNSEEKKTDHVWKPASESKYFLPTATQQSVSESDCSVSLDDWTGDG